MFLIQKRTIFVALLCWSRNKMMQVEERHYYYYWRECECVWVDVWPRSLASSPAPHATHSLRTNVYQDRKKPLKDGFTTSYTDATYKNLNKRRKVDFEATGNLFRAYTQAIFWPHTKQWRSGHLRPSLLMPSSLMQCYSFLWAVHLTVLTFVNTSHLWESSHMFSQHPKVDKNLFVCLFF